MELTLEKSQASETIKRAVLELNKAVNNAESLGLKVDFSSRNLLSLKPDLQPLTVVVQEVITY